MQDNYLPSAKYQGHAKNENEFSAFSEEGEFYFAYLDENNNVILRSEGYQSELSRNNGIASVTKNMELEERYKTIQLSDKTWVLSLRAGNHQEIAQSCPVNTEAEALAFLPSERAKAREAALKLSSASSSNSGNNVQDDYLICREYEARISDSKSEKYSDFISFQHTNGEFYFAWVVDGEVAMRSEGYASASARDNGIESVIKNKDSKDRFANVSAHGAHFLVLKAGNNQEIARSCPRKTEEETLTSLTKWLGLAAAGLGITSNISADNSNNSANADLISKISKEIEVEKSAVNPPIDGTLNVKQEIVKPIQQVSEPILENVTTTNAITNTITRTNVVNKLKSEATIEKEKVSAAATASLNQDGEGNEGCMKWIWWILLGLLLLALLWWLFQMDGCKKLTGGGSDTAVAVDTVTVNTVMPVADTLVLDSAAMAAKSAWASLGSMVNLALPDGTSISVPANGSEKKLVEYLNAICGTSAVKETWFNLDRVLFKTGSSELNEVSFEQLDNIAKIFKAYPKTTFKFGGYTDNVGNPNFNKKLSGERAASAAKGIETRGGIAADRMRSEGYGQEHPVCPANDTEECKAQNRRVSVRVDKCDI
jgi:outer membrane protein OmpA-like peptidoglycan-associated protein/uncharacterized protein YegP (UPF0339 family)